MTTHSPVTPPAILEDEAARTGQRVRCLRRQKHLSFRQLARMAGVTAGYLSEVEAGRVSPTIVTLRKVLLALETDLGAFFSLEPDTATGRIFPRREMPEVVEAARRYTFILPRRPGINMEIIEEIITPGDAPEFEAIPTDMAGLVLEGELLLEIEGEPPARVGAGDAYYLPRDLRARGRSARADAPVRLLSIMQTPRY